VGESFDGRLEGDEGSLVGGVVRGDGRESGFSLVD
jgi:hypothetical protein